MDFNSIISTINDFVWGPVMLVLLVGTGIFLTFRLKFRPWRNLGFALRSVFKKSDKSDKTEGDISPFQSLMTALAATVGTGNIAGVATAMVLGGPGALVWMWISAVFGLSTKYAESLLAVKYRVKNERGEMAGGPMYAMKHGIKWKWLGSLLAVLFAVFAVAASFGIGNLTQANTIADAIDNTFITNVSSISLFGANVPLSFVIVGIVLAVLAAVILLGGIKSIGRVCGVVVPVMAVFYSVGGLICIFMNVGNLPSGVAMIFSQAFSTEAIGGGVAGTMLSVALRYGVARGVFSNEAGLGSAPIAAAAAKTDHPARQGYINMTGTFFDTIIICSITGLAIAASGLLQQGTDLTGARLTIAAFETAMGPIGAYIVTIGIALFAFSTILGWEYYGERSLEYLTKSYKVNIVYRIVFSAIVFLGCTSTLETVWNFSDTMNGLMAIPNLICLLLLSNVIAKETKNFQKNILKREKVAKKIRA